MFGKVSLNEAFQSVNQIVQQGVQVPTDIFYSLLQCCIKEENLLVGRKVQALIRRCGYESNPFLGSHLIRMFSVCGSLVEAHQVFGKVQKPDVFTWNAIISAYAKLGNDEQALALYHQLNASGSTPDAHVFVAVLKACHSFVSLLLLHAHLIESGFETGLYIPVTLMDSYAKCGNLEDAVSTFYGLSEKTVVAWNAMIKGYTHHGHTDDALHLFLQMQTEGVQPNHVTFVSILKTSSSASFLCQGKSFHSQILTCGFESNITVRNTLIDMYAKCSSLNDAQKVFASSLKRDVVTWNAMIAGYVQHKHDLEALQVFQHMQHIGMEPNQVTFSSIVKACCSDIIHSDQGKLVHGFIVERGFETNMYVASTLINMYAKCGRVEDGCSVFVGLLKPNLVTWSAIIACYAQNEYGQMALVAFQELQQEGLHPNQVLYASVLKACSDLLALDLGKLIHAQIIESGMDFNVFVASTLIDMYTKCNSSCDACNVFDRFSKGNVVMWSAMIAGHAQYGRSMEALKLYNVMQDDGMEPNEITFLTLLNLCSDIAALDQGMLIHAHIIEMGHEADIPVSNSLVDMYANCGSLHNACRILERSQGPNVVTWNALLAGCAKHSNYEMALKCTEVMQQQNVKPNDVTFVSLLSLCNHMGLVHEGHCHFKSMREEFEILPTYEHYTCTVDLLGRAGFLVEAEDMLNTMPFWPDIVALVSLLSHCKTYENYKLARQCFDGIIAIDSRSASGFVHMSKMHASDGLKEYADVLEDFRNNANAWKKPGMACIEVEERMFEFIVEGKTLPEIDGICAKLKSLTAHMKEEGYLPKSESASFHQTFS